MTENSSSESAESGTNEHFLRGLARAFAGAVIFAFTIIMTMEMWSLGFSIPPYRLIIYILVSIPLLVGLSRFVGFEDTENLADDIIDAFVGYAVGFISSAALMFLFGLVDFSMSAYEIIGKISIQSVTAAIGAMYAQSELGGAADKNGNKKSDKKKEETNYRGELFLMTIGAIILAMSPAPTEEMYLIAFKMSDIQTILLVIISLLMMHAFVYSVGFKGEEQEQKKWSLWLLFLRFTVVGYAIALLISLYLLWIFGSLDGMSLKEIIKVMIVLGFPAALGAAASRVII